MGQKGDLAFSLFTEGYNCCQAVAGAFAQELGMPLDTVMRMASGFGGGMGRMREVCGAVSGMTLVLGALQGYNDSKATDEKTQTYARVQDLAQQFKAETGSILCRELLGLPAPEGTPQAEVRTAQYYEKRPCGELCRMAADLLAHTVLYNQMCKGDA